MSDVIELKIMINRVLIPRIRQLEQELSSLREHTWPYVQFKKESYQLNDMESKYSFLKNLDDETIRKLIQLKSTYSVGNDLHFIEYNRITQSLHNNFC